MRVDSKLVTTAAISMVTTVASKIGIKSSNNRRKCSIENNGANNGHENVNDRPVDGGDEYGNRRSDDGWYDSGKNRSEYI